MPVRLIQGIFLSYDQANSLAATIALLNHSNFNSTNGFKIAKEFNNRTASTLRLYYASYDNTFILGFTAGEIDGSLWSSKLVPVLGLGSRDNLDSQLNIVLKETGMYLGSEDVTLELYSY